MPPFHLALETPLMIIKGHSSFEKGPFQKWFVKFDKMVYDSQFSMTTIKGP
jgi:hypothetical protein